jgi:hypothetical protein
MITSYKELSLGKWEEIYKLKDEEDNETTQIKLLSILSYMTEEEILDLPLNEFKALNNLSAFLLDEPQKKQIETEYLLGDTIYELTSNVDKLIVSQFIDYQTCVKDVDKYLVELIGVFLIPKGKKYNTDYDIRDAHEDIRKYLSIEDAVSLSAFFLILSQSWLEATETYLIKKMKKMMKKQKKK